MRQSVLFSAVRNASGAGKANAIVDDRGELPYRQLLSAAERFAPRLDQHREAGRLVVARTSHVFARATVALAADLVGIPVLHADPQSQQSHDGLVVSDRPVGGAAGWDSGSGFQLWTTETGPPRVLDGVPDDAQLFLTSGSTGVPLCVARGADVVLRDCHRIADFMGYEPGATTVAATPAFHSYGFTYGLVAALVRGSTVRHCSSRSVPSQFVRAVTTLAARTFVCLPFHLHLLARQPDVLDFGPLEKVVSSGGPLPSEAADTVADSYAFTLYNAYGASETGAVSLQAVDRSVSEGEVGAPLPGITATLAEVDGVADAGELLLHTDSLAAGYLESTGLRQLPGARDRYRTGDLARLVDGRIRLTGRLKNIINVAGKKVSPSEIEQVLGGHPAVAEAHVLAAPDAVRGQVPVARVVLRSAATDAELLAWCQSRLSANQIPRQFIFVDELLKTATGKVIAGSIPG